MRSLSPSGRATASAPAVAAVLAAALVTAALVTAGASAAASPGAAEGWVEARSPSFTLYTDAAPERGAELALALERFRAVFARLAPEIGLRSPVPTRILAFRDAAAYAPYKTTPDVAGVRVLGQFLTAPDGPYPASEPPAPSRDAASLPASGASDATSGS